VQEVTTEQQIIRAVRRINFCAGHRIAGHETKCRHLHGHNFQVFFHAQAAAGLDSIGRVIDFSVLKHKLGTWIEDNWDHGFLLWDQDVEAIAALKLLAGQKLFLMRQNPTAENIAATLMNDVAPKLLEGTGVSVEKVVVWETENCFAEIERSQP
jgi:6-pyruvoyltetrahydropterin/6-carboxytetrahydropterin synthase